MGTDSIILFLLPLFIAVIVGFMLNKLIALALGFLGIAVAVWIGTHVVLASIPFVLLSLFFFGLIGRLYFFEKRIVGYIVEGQQLQYDALTIYALKGYLEAMRRWTNKVANDIGKNKGKSARDLFLSDVSMKATLEQLEHNPEVGLVSAIIGQRLTYLKDLQRGL